MNMNDTLNNKLNTINTGTVAQPAAVAQPVAQAPVNHAGGAMSIMDKLNAAAPKSSDYTGWEAGKYLVTIKKAEMGTATNGNEYAAITFEGLDGEVVGKSERQTIWFLNFDGEFDTTAIEKFKGQVEKLGIDISDFQVMLSQMIGKQINLTIKQFPNPTTGELGKKKHYFYEVV